MKENITMNPLAQATKEKIIKQLETVYDPEIGLDIYNLGLIYEINLKSNGTCYVVATTTEIACGCVDTIPADIINALTQLTEIKKVKVEIVYQPAWKPTRITRLGRMALGISLK